MEYYFWAFVVALMIFMLGGAVSIYQGVAKVVSPEPISRVWINFAVLGAAVVLEGGSLVVAWREFRRAHCDVAFSDAIRGSKDPGIFAVLLEDATALTGLFIALLASPLPCGSTLRSSTVSPRSASVACSLAPRRCSATRRAASWSARALRPR